MYKHAKFHEDRLRNDGAFVFFSRKSQQEINKENTKVGSMGSYRNLKVIIYYFTNIYIGMLVIMTSNYTIS